MSGGFAGGLAQGLNQGMQMFALNESLKSREKQDARMEAADKRDSEAHDIKMQEVANNRKLTETWAGILGWKPEMAGGSPVRPDAPSMGAPAQPPQTPSSINLAGPIPSGGLTMAAPAAPFAAGNPVGGLQPQQQAAPVQQSAPMSADQFIQRQLLQGNAFGNPQILNQMAAAAFQHGQSDKGIAFLNQAHVAHEKGLPAAIGKLMEGDPKGAGDIIRSRGTNLEGDLTPVEGKPHAWKGIVDGKEREFNLREMAMSANPLEAFTKMDAARETARTAAMDERKQKNVERKTDAEIGFLKSRSDLADANADKADRDTTGGLRPSRSSESAVNTSLKRRGDSFDRISSVRNEEGKFEVDPMKRQELDSAANQYLTFIENKIGEELDSRDHNKFTDVMVTYPIGGTPQQIEQWQEKQLFPRFGLRRKAKEAGAQTKATATAPSGSKGLALVAQPTGPKPGSLAALQEQGRIRQAVTKEMEGVQKALQTPGLDVNQKKALSLKAQELATRRDSLK